MSRMARSRGGRPPLGRKRVQFAFSLEDEARERLIEQAARAGYRPGTYMERVICLAHDFESPFLPPPQQPLPTAVPADELQQHVQDIAPEDCEQARRTGSSHVLIRVDKALADPIQEWCNSHDAPYGGYVRSVLRLAAGFTAEELQQRPVQGDLLAAARYEEERAVAS